MAHLPNVKGTLRFSLALAALETPVPVKDAAEAPPKAVVPQPEERVRFSLPVVSAAAPPGRVLAQASVEYFDKRDKEFWPFVRQPILWLGAGDAEGLLEGLSQLIRDEIPGFAFRAGEASEIAFLVGKREAEASATATSYAVEVGLDLGPLLAESAGDREDAGEALSLFRFNTGRPALVAFAQGFKAELEELKRDPHKARAP